MYRMTAGQAAAYLTGHFDQALAALAAGDQSATLVPVRQIAADGYPDVANVLLDVLIATVRGVAVADAE